MQAVVWIVRLAIVVVLVWFAVKNAQVITIYGLPNQTLGTFEASVEWCLRRGVPRVRAWPLMLLRGTPLEAQRER